MQWVRWAMTEALQGRSFVFINMDETTISQLKPAEKGFVPARQVQRAHGMIRRKTKPNKEDVRTCLLGAVCDQPALQPHLPQVVLPSYSKHVRPPQAALQEYKNTGAPLEYWHDTNGWTSSNTITRWLTRMRSVVSTYNPLLWIVVVWDCASVHLNEVVLRHARRLGMLVLFIPAGLTHQLQVLDVYIYAFFKRRIREHMLRCQRLSERAQLDRHGRIQSVGKAVHEAIVNVDCSNFFVRLGLSGGVDALRDEVFSLVCHAPIAPALPSRSQFAAMTGLAEHTARTQNVHSLAMQGWLQLRGQPLTAHPMPGAVAPLRHVEPADSRVSAFPADSPMSWDDVRMARLRRRHAEQHPELPVGDQAVNAFLRDV